MYDYFTNDKCDFYFVTITFPSESRRGVTPAPYPDVQAFMDTFRKMEGVVEQYNRDLAKWEQQVKEKEKPNRPPEKESVRDRLRQLQAEGKQQRTRKKSQDRER